MVRPAPIKAATACAVSPRALPACPAPALQLKEATESLTRLRRQHTELQSKHDSLSELSTQQQQTIERLEDELAKANRLNRNYLNEVTKQDQMLSLVCAYKGEDERRDIAMLLHENITLEEKVERLQAQVKRLARENVAALNEDWEGFDD